MSPVLSDELRQRIIDANHGRDAGWIVKYKEQPIALVTDCSHQDPDMFWDQYTLTWLTQDTALVAQAETPDFWCEPEITFENREFPDVGLPSGQMISPHTEVGKVEARRLYLYLDKLDEGETQVEPSDTWGCVKARLRKVFRG